jgi:hypothetical protein
MQIYCARCVRLDQTCSLSHKRGQMHHAVCTFARETHHFFISNVSLNKLQCRMIEQGQQTFAAEMESI